jgi:hypothetical protein
MLEAGESKKAGALTGACAPEAPNPKFQIPRKSQTSNSKEERRAEFSFDHWVLRFVWDLGFGFWDFQRSGAG